MNYYKYLKYKIKYYNLKDELLKKSSENKFTNYEKLNNQLLKNYTNTINSMELQHDIKDKSVSDTTYEFYDFINHQKMSFDDSIKDPEKFSKMKIIKDAISTNEKINADYLKDMFVIFDNTTQNYNISQKIYYLFGIEKYIKTFVGESEKILTSDSINIDKTQFWDKTKKRIKDEFINEAMSIGISIKMDKIISFQPFIKNDTTEIVNELKKTYEIYNEYYTLFKDSYFDTDFEKTFKYIFINKLLL